MTRIMNRIWNFATVHRACQKVPEQMRCKQLLMASIAAALMSSSMFALKASAMTNWVIDYPENGVLLGQGWNSLAVAKAPGTCIVFARAQSQDAQSRDMQLTSVTSTYQLQRSLDIDASAQYKSIGASIKGKAGFAQKIDLNSSLSNIAAYAVVDNGRVFAAPPPVESATKIASLIQQGKTPGEIAATLGIDSRQLARNFARVLPDLSSPNPKARQKAIDVQRMNAAASAKSGTAPVDPDFPGAIALLPKYRDMAASNPALFRKTCGDSFVLSISEGGESSALFTFETQSLGQQREISAAMEGSGWGAGASASMKSTIKTLADKTKMTIRWFQSGGSGEPLPTSLDTFYHSLQGFPKAVQQHPWKYKIELARYEDLPNWPSSGKEQSWEYEAMDRLAFEHGKWLTLNHDLNTILNATSDRLGRTQGYLLGRGISRKTFLTCRTKCSGGSRQSNRR